MFITHTLVPLQADFAPLLEVERIEMGFHTLGPLVRPSFTLKKSTVVILIADIARHATSMIWAAGLGVYDRMVYRLGETRNDTRTSWARKDMLSEALAPFRQNCTGGQFVAEHHAPRSFERLSGVSSNSFLYF